MNGTLASVGSRHPSPPTLPCTAMGVGLAPSAVRSGWTNGGAAGPGLAGLTAPPLPPRTVAALGVLTGAQLFSLQKEELRAVSPEEGARVYSQVTVQRALLEVSRARPEGTRAPRPAV